MADHISEFDNLSPIKQAMLQLREMRQQLDEMERSRSEPIAVIGMGLRLPGGINNPQSFWNLLHEGIDAITDIPADRWDSTQFYDSDPTAPGKMYTRGGGFLNDIGLFDAPFFGIAPREAITMDPQQRLLLQVSWEALEHAGQAPDKLHNTQTGVFIAISNSDYGRMVASDLDDIDVYYATGNTFSVAAGRLSYFLGLKGPSVAIDTACSGSLVAMHLACQSLRNMESDLALAGGVNLILTPEGNINFSKAQMMARDDRCKTFDADADGYVRGEGCGIVVLKRLSDAMANGDNILAVIRGSAINQDGRSSGLTAPNGPSQEAVIRQALANAQVRANQVQYIEAHGTGTSLGDPIEVQALAAALCEDRSKDAPLMIGAVKTNLGHLEAAAGIAGFMKVILSLQHEEIPPHLHLKTLNPRIDWDRIAVTVPTRPTPWLKNESPRIAGISSFGFSGTNAHVILEEAPRATQNKASIVEPPLHILNVSAKQLDALRESAGRYEARLAESSARFTDICFTSNVGRAHLTHRLSVIARSAAEAREKLAGFLYGDAETGVFNGQVSNVEDTQVSFLFTGHGSQYIRMGQQLFNTQPTFQAELERCAELLKTYLDKPLLSVLYPTSTEEDSAATQLMNTMTYAQPALFAIEYSLAVLWRSWGIEPTFVMGHSVGEYAAACIAGAFSLADGLKLVATRGRLMDSLPEKGRMVTVFAGEAQVAEIIAPHAEHVSIAVVNGSTHVVISGTESAIRAVTSILKSRGFETRELAIAQAAHSPVLDPILDEFERIASEIAYTRPTIGVISCTTGQLVLSELTNAGYWRRHLRETVRFDAAMQTLHEKGQRIFIEVGPHPTMLGMGRRSLPELDESGLWLPSLRKAQEDWQEILESLANLHVHGFAVDWTEFERHNGGCRTQLPTYPWAKHFYWIERSSHKQSANTTLSPIEPWEQAVATGRKQARQAPLDLAVNTLDSKWDILDQLTKAYIVQTLRSWNIFAKPKETCTVDEVLQQTNVLPTYRGLLSRWLDHLTDMDLLTESDGCYTAPRPLPHVDVVSLLEKAENILADNAPLLNYVRRCGDKIAPVLTGKEQALETLFPEGSYETVDYLYHHWPLIQYFNGIMREIVEGVASSLPAGKKLRILEIGAGTGGSTAALTPHLPVDQVQYTFTDLSDFFLARAEERFRAHPFMQYGTLDIEKDPEAQGYAVHSADVIIAANALHATRDLNSTLAHVKKLLAPGGFLILLEGTRYLSWLDVTTSLIEGWGRFEDEFRKENPLLHASVWQEALQKNGFTNAASFPEDNELSHLLVHNIILAQVEATALSLEGADTPQMRSQLSSGETETTDAVSLFMQQLTEALPADRHERLVNYVREHVAKILRLPASYPLGQQDRLMDVGLDSLMAVELRSRLGKGLEVQRPLSATLVFDHPTIQAIAGYLDNELFDRPEPTVVSQTTAPQKSDTTATENEIADLSDEEVEKLLLKKLGDIH